MPTTAPNTDTITASHRTVRRNCRRVIPTARSSPISRVRSKTDSASVIAMPMMAITIAMLSRPVMTASSWLIWPSCCSRNSALLCRSACGKSSSAACDLGAGGVGIDAVGELGEHELIAWRQIGSPPRASRSRCTSSRRASRRRRSPTTVSVRSTPFWNVTSTVSPTSRSRSSAGSLCTINPSSSSAVEAAGRDVEVDELGERDRVDRGELLVVVVDGAEDEPERRHRLQYVELRHVLLDHRRQPLERLVGDDVVGRDRSVEDAAERVAQATRRTRTRR